MFKEVTDSIKNNLSDKISSPFYGSFVVSWLLWNWKIWYVTFFIDSKLLSDKYDILKIDYIVSLYNFNWSSFFHLFFFPLLSSFIVVFFLPYLTGKYYEKWINFEYKNKLFKSRKDKEFFEKEEKKLDAKINVLKKEEKIKAERTNEEIWDEEFNNFKKSDFFDKFDLIIKTVYQKQGRTETLDWFLPFDVKAFGDSNGILIISKDKNNYEIISLTDKGKHFMKRYNESK